MTTAAQTVVLPIPDAALDVLRYRYGIRTDDPPAETLDLLPLDCALRIIRLQPSDAESLNVNAQLALRHFVAYTPYVPSFADLSLISGTRRQVTIEVSSYLGRDWDVSGVRKGPCFWVRSVHQGGSNLKWKLALPDPISAVQILRQGWGPDLRDVARELLLRGIAFNTFRDSASAGYDKALGTVYHDHHEIRDVSLGTIMDAGLVADYRVYVLTRNKLLQRSHTARAALLHGGIVWRLAVDALGLEQAVREVLADATINNQCAIFGGMPWLVGDEADLWDDVLSEAEVSLICGVYKRSTETPSQTEDASWWPKPNYWSGSVLDVRCWTADCEQWYQQRVQAICSNTQGGELKNQTQWWSALKYTRKETNKLISTTAESATQLLLQLPSSTLLNNML